jgi:hypothetical protein
LSVWVRTGLLTIWHVRYSGVNSRPREQSRLHALIIELTTANNAGARARDFAEASAAFKKNQLWETEQPQHLWDPLNRGSKSGIRRACRGHS